MKPAVVLPLAFVLLLLMVIPVSAAPPIIETGHWDFPPVEVWPGICPGIVVIDHEVIDYRYTTYFDNQGNVKSIRLFVQGTQTYYNEANPEVQLIGKSAGSGDIDLNTGLYRTVSGLVSNLTYPGYGTVLVVSGHWEIYPDGHVGGKYSIEDPEDIEQFCSLLSGD